jgi:tetratricopeptide (TPR) repeat protein
MVTTALVHHKAGRLNEAERIYRQILAIDATHADSLHLLGMIAYQAGRLDDATAMIGKAIAVDKTQAAYHLNLGTVFHAQGRLDEAAACYESAIAIQPELAKAHYNLGNIFQAREQLDDAAACYGRAIAHDPKLVEAHYNLGNVSYAQFRLDEAVVSYERALAIEPEKYEARHNLGNALQAQGKLDEALACYEEVLKSHPDYAKAHFSLGGLLHALGKVDAALKRYETALTLQPDFAEAQFAQSLAQLLRGAFISGWNNYESRWQTKQHTPPMRTYQRPLWTGEKLSEGRVLIWGEQGIGDEIMFAGLIPDVLRTGSQCMLDCDKRLRALFARSFPEVEVIASRAEAVPAPSDAKGDSRIEFAAHIPSGSLPRLFRSNESAFAATTSPYLIADADQRKWFRTRYADGRRLIGLAWHTNNRKTGSIRSIDLARFAPLFKRNDARWICLQYGDHEMLEGQIDAARAPLVVDRSVDQLVSIDAFAAQIAALDLVITIDNSTAHLAGALGIPTWVLLPFAADWRWFERREDSPWYPTVRLFRQPKRDDWHSVFRCVLQAL